MIEAYLKLSLALVSAKQWANIMLHGDGAEDTIELAYGASYDGLVRDYDEAWKLFEQLPKVRIKDQDCADIIDVCMKRDLASAFSRSGQNIPENIRPARLALLIELLDEPIYYALQLGVEGIADDDLELQIIEWENGKSNIGMTDVEARELGSKDVEVLRNLNGKDKSEEN